MHGEADLEAGTEARAAARRGVGAALLAGLAGALGLLPGVRGALDPTALLAWLALLALPAGAWVGARARLSWAARLLAPALWSFLVLEAQLASGGGLPRASLGLGVAVGAYLVGLALGRWWGSRAAPWAALFVVLLALWPARGALGAGSGGRTPGPLDRALLELSPLVVALESAGLDWTHAQPEVYAHSGVEVLPRRPVRGILAAPVLLLVGWGLAHAAHRKKGPWPSASTSARSPRS